LIITKLYLITKSGKRQVEPFGLPEPHSYLDTKIQYIFCVLQYPKSKIVYFEISQII
jgi:hypothetical protein